MFSSPVAIAPLCILSAGLALAAFAGCGAARLSHETRAFSPEEPLEGGTMVRIGGTLVEPGSHVIVLPPDPTPTEQTAARELQWHLQRITGQELDVVAQTQVGDRRGFFIGRCDKYRLPREQMESLGTDGLIIRTHGPDVQLTGNQRGVLYAVSVFLEDYLDCRWFAPDCVRVPTSGTIRVPPIDRRYVPPLKNRATDYPEHRDTLFAMRSRFTSDNARLDEAHGGKVSYHPFVHSFHALVPPEEYFEQHPEYFALVEGERVPDQLCLTNPEVLEIAKRRVRQWIEGHPEAQIISVSQNDIRLYCHCEKCTALAEKEGSQAGPLLHFINAIAEEIGRDHPDKLISTLAYQYTQTPPKHVRPARNVTMRLCSIRACFSHPLEVCSSEQNRAFVEDLKGWSKICDKLSIWDYTICYAHTLAPFPNLHVLAGNINTFVEHGAVSVYEEANYFSRGGEMAPLRTYILAKTLWDPSYETDRAIDEFVAAYYGDAAPHVRAYIDLLHKPFRDGKGPHVHIWGNAPADYLRHAFTEQALALFAEAHKAVRDDPVRLQRVRLARLPVLYMALLSAARYELRGDRLVRTGSPPGLDLESEFWDVVQREGITHHREGTRIEDLRNELRVKPESIRVQTLCNEQVEVECVPGYGGRILSLRNRRTGRNWLKIRRDEQGILLAGSGSELYSRREPLVYDWHTPFEVLRRSENEIAMRASLENAVVLQREVSLSGSTVRMRDSLANEGEQPQQVMLRVHPVVAIPEPDSTCLRVWNEEGEAHRLELPRVTVPEYPAPERYLRGSARPAGRWAVVDSSTGESLHHRVTGGEIGEYYVYMRWGDPALTLEVWSPERSLSPGEKITIEHEYTLK